MARPERRIDMIKVNLVTGARGTDDPVRIRFNGFELTLHRISGGTDPGETYEGEFFVASVMHSCRLQGPLTGYWDLRSLEVDYLHTDGRLSHFGAGPLTLAAGSELDILGVAPASAFEV
jgi:hypothetical protein